MNIRIGASTISQFIRIGLAITLMLVALAPLPGFALENNPERSLTSGNDLPKERQIDLELSWHELSQMKAIVHDNLFLVLAGITVDPTTGLVTTEAGDTDTFTVVLDQAPSDPVTITLSSSDPTEGTVSPSSLTFEPNDWDQAQTVTVTGVNDGAVDGDVAYTIVTDPAVSADPLYDGLDASDVGVTNRDDEGVGITVDPTTGLVTTEAGDTDTFTVVLDQAPNDPVTITLSSSDPTEGTVSPSSLTFETNDWDQAQTVTVTGVNDGAVDGDVAYTIVTDPAVSADPLYDGLDASDVGVTNRDDEGVGITVDPTTGLVTTEAGDTDTFTVVLDQAPNDPVTIALSSSDPTEGTVSPSSLTFETNDWDQAQTVTVMGQDDDLNDGEMIYDVITDPTISDDPLYNGVDPADVGVTNRDDEGVGITVDPTTGLVTTEAGDTDTFTVVLDQAPNDPVTIALSSSDPTEGTVSPSSLTFETNDWDQAQTVTVMGQDDDLNDGEMIYDVITDPTISDDPLYNGVDPADVAITNQDNDAPLAVDDEYTVLEDNELVRNSEQGVLANDIDENDPTLTATLDTNVVSGTLTLISDGSFIYTPDTNFWGTDGFGYIASDGVFTDTGTVTITVLPANDIPIANNDTFTMTEDSFISVPPPGVIQNDHDQGDGDVLTSVLLTDVISGTLVFVLDGSFVYTPTLNFFGTDEFMYFLTDEVHQSEAATVTIHIDSINDPPTGINDEYLTNATNLDPMIIQGPGVLENDIDPENSPLTAILASQPLNGTIELNLDGSFVYTPTVNFSGVDFFTYRAWDGEEESNLTQVEITIDITAPESVTWISPVGNQQIYHVSGEIVQLEVLVDASVSDLSGVEFYRWDSVNQTFQEIEFVSLAPYRVDLDTSILSFEWNQIFARAVDLAGNQSIREFIWLIRDYTPRLWLPVIMK